jgi:hypothetical protein
MKMLISLWALICSCHVVFSQGQLLKDDIDFMAFTIKDTYAGYRDKVKGNEFDALVKKVKRSHSKDTFALLSQITSFFKDKHMSLFDDSIRYRKIDTLQCKKDSQMVQQYFANPQNKDPYEGYWLSGYDYCVLALKKVKSHPVTYYGYVAETKSRAIPGYCILKMTQQKDGTYYTDYTSEDLRIRAFLHAKFKNTNTLWLNSLGGIWRRLPNYQPGILKNLTTFSFKPAFEILDSNTVLLKMPSFTTPNISIYDSIMKANAKLIEQCNTLIIDIRNNFGGYVNSYRPLFPYIYTNPIIHTGGSTLISNHFMKQYDDKIKYFQKSGDTASANSYINWRDTFVAKKGQFDYNEPAILAENLPILPNPKNVAIIINNNCLSAAELMLLNFRQSKKVKFFGEHTGGAVDYLNVMSFRLPHSKYSLSAASVKRLLKPHEPSYDATGIPPDIEISDDVTDWVAFVKDYYHEFH